MSRKKIEIEARRQFIVAEAAALFAQKGVENTNMDDIAKAVGYTRRTLYSYFKSNDEICLLVYFVQLKEQWAYQKSSIAKVNTGQEKLYVWGKSLFEFMQKNPHALKLNVYWDFKGIVQKRIDAKIFSDFEILNNELAEGLREIFKLGIEDNSFRANLTIEICISQFIYSLRAILQRAFSDGYSFVDVNAEKYVTHYLDLFISGISNLGEKNV